MFRNVLLFGVAFSAISLAANAQEAPSGFYTGAGVGYINQKAKLNRLGDTPHQFRFNDDDVIVSLFGGYNFKLNGPWFTGLEFGFDTADTGFIASNSQLNLTGRAGRMLDENFLAYAKVSYSHRFAKNFGDYDGFGLGGGGEFRLTDKWWLRAEYTYTDLGSSRFRIAPTTLESAELSSHQFVTSAVFRF